MFDGFVAQDPRFKGLEISDVVVKVDKTGELGSRLFPCEVVSGQSLDDPEAIGKTIQILLK